MTATSIPDNRETIIDVDDKEAKAEDNREAKNNEKTVVENNIEANNDDEIEANNGDNIEANDDDNIEVNSDDDIEANSDDKTEANSDDKTKVNNDYDIEAIIEKCNDNNLPKFKIFRKFIYVLAGICYVSYSVYLIIQLGTEYPMVITKYDYINNIDIPSFFEILRCDTKFNNQTEIQNGCQKYISSPNVTEGGGDRKRCHTFKANKDIQYILGNPNGLKKLKFYYKIDNATDAVRENIGVPLINIRIFSPDLLDVSEMDKAVRSRLDLDWNFIPGIIGHVSLVESFHTIIDRFPLIHNPPPMPDGTNGYFSVAAGDFVQEEISEKRTTTILSTIASAGGAFGVIGAILVCLFGSRILDPWGIARKIAVNPWYLKDILVDFGYKMIGKQPKSSTDILNDEQLNAAIPRKFLDTSFLSNS
ncbi:12436_t:CDS:2 [Entrophospora sp. SA101]|nr:12436_t:CDS:2 [Entrophospora sp. SA101]